MNSLTISSVCHGMSRRCVRLQLVQELSKDDFDKRIEFCDICNDDEYFTITVVLSAEANFCLNLNR